MKHFIVKQFPQIIRSTLFFKAPLLAEDMRVSRGLFLWEFQPGKRWRFRGTSNIFEKSSYRNEEWTWPNQSNARLDQRTAKLSAENTLALKLLRKAGLLFFPWKSNSQSCEDGEEEGMHLFPSNRGPTSARPSCPDRPLPTCSGLTITPPGRPHSAGSWHDSAAESGWRRRVFQGLHQAENTSWLLVGFQ